MAYFKYIIFILFFTSCSTEESSDLIYTSNLLSTYVEGRSVDTGAVIACAGNNTLNTNIVEIYFYREANSTNYKLYETNSSDVDPNEFSNYKYVDLDDAVLFNGYLNFFEGSFSSERWFIVSFEIDNEIKLSNPIRSKNLTQPTLFSDQININQEESLMPLFTWDINSEANNAIFFQVLSTTDNDLLSGTYTFENQFQYYNTSNVVLNITDGTPPDLSLGQDYKLTVMDVSEDNWVNELLITQFTVE